MRRDVVKIGVDADAGEVRERLGGARDTILCMIVASNLTLIRMIPFV